MVKRIFLFLFVSLFILITFTPEQTRADWASWYSDTDFNYRRHIVVDPDLTDEDLSSFPLLIYIDADADISANAQHDADDILFTDSNGTTQLDHEIEEYNSGTGELMAWVEVPTIDSVTETEIYMYYGDGSVGSQEDINGTWDASFEAVWHLNEAVSNSSTHEDSTADANHLTNQDNDSQMATAAGATGMAGTAIDFPYADSDDYLRRGSDETGVADDTTYTVSAWINSTITISQAIFSEGDDSGGTGVVALRMNRFNAGEGGHEHRDDSSNLNDNYSDQDIHDGEWHHVAVQRNSSTDFDVIIDGVDYGGSDSTSVGAAAVDEICIGELCNQFTDNALFEGIIDEVRVSSVVRSEGWLNAEYLNMKYPFRYVSVGGEQEYIGQVSGNWENKKEIDVDSSAMLTGGDQHNFPLLVYEATDSNLVSDAQVDADDILFTDDSESIQLAHEIEYYNSTTGELVAWVDIETIRNSTDETIFMYYNYSSATNQENYDQVWNSQYVGVWHMAEDPSVTTDGDCSGGSDEICDSTKYDNDGNMGGTMLSGDLVDGDGGMGKGIDFDGTDDNFNAGSNTALDDAFIAGGTVLAWAFPDTFGENSFGRIVDKSSSTGAADGYAMQVGDTDDNLVFETGWDTTDGSWGSNDNTITLDTWYMLTTTYDKLDTTNDPTFYVDTTSTFQQYNNPAGDPESDAAQDLYIGNYSAGSRTFDGVIDELRISRTVRSSDWITAVYNNTNAPATYLTFNAASANTPTTLYRSVGTDATELLDDVSIDVDVDNGTNTATFTAAVDNDIGVGDVIEYSGNIAFIHARTSSTVFTVYDKDGNAPTDSGGNVDAEVYRAYTSLDNWETQVENSNITEPTEDDVNPNLDLVAANTILQVACYGDGNDTDNIVIAGWTTGTNNYIRIFTPVSTSEVGATQRHSGTWDATKYNLSTTGASLPIIVNVGNVRIEGLQASGDHTSSYVIEVNPSATDEIKISHNIVDAGGNGMSGIREEGGTTDVEIYNNIVYDGAIGIQAKGGVGKTSSVYNNTVSDSSTNCYDSENTNGTVELKNNIANDCTTEAYESAAFDSGTNNISDTSDNFGDNPRHCDVSFQNEGSDDFRLASSDTCAVNAGADLSADGNLAISDDIVGTSRPASMAFDAGAHEQSDPDTISLYRSVGTDTAEQLGDGGSTTVTVEDGTVTFSAAVPNDVGVGDAVVYVDGNSDDQICFINGRTSSTVFSCQNQVGAEPVYAAAGSTVDVYRVFPSLSNWENHTLNTDENSNIDADVDDQAIFNSLNLSTDDVIAQVACYADGADTTKTTVDTDWTTGTSNYIRIFTPVSTSEVGTTQRHSGVWNTSFYNLAVGAGNNPVLHLQVDNVRVEGLQVSGAHTAGHVVEFEAGATGENHFSHGIIKAGSGQAGLREESSANTVKIYNNLVYDVTTGINVTNVTGKTSSVYNNTVVDATTNCYTATFAAGTYDTKNNIAQNCTNDDFDNTGAYDNGTNNVSDLAGAFGDNPRHCDVTFENEGSDDFRLASSDTCAVNAGADLSADADLVISDDIAGTSRPASMEFDVGAHEQSDPDTISIYRSVGTDITEQLGDGGSTTATIEDGAVTFSAAVPDDVGVGDAVVYVDDNSDNQICFINGRTSSTVFSCQNQVGAEPVYAAAGATVDVYRSFGDMRNWEDQLLADVNSNINADVDDFVLYNSTDLVTDDVVAQVACYADGLDSGGVVVIADFTTGASNYIRLYTPTDTTEVGNSQRHRGVYSVTDGYAKTNATSDCIQVLDEYVRLEGLQCLATGSGTFDEGFYIAPAANPAEVHVSENIVVGSYSGGDTDAYGIRFSTVPGAATGYAYNNIVYDFVNGATTSFHGFRISDADWTIYLYNNTIQNCYEGVTVNSGTVIAKNNLVMDATTDYSGTFDAASTDNQGEDGTAPNTNEETCSVTFEDASGDNFHVASTDTCVIDAGADLTSDANLEIDFDIDGNTRPAATDIGADEVFSTFYWVGGANDSVNTRSDDWSTTNPTACDDGNGDAGVVPGAGDNAIFDADCDNDADIDSSWTVGDLELQTGYAGEVANKPTAFTLTVDTDDITVTGGTLNVGIGTIDVKDDLIINGGTLTAPSTDSSSGYLAIEGSFNYSSGTFTDNGGTVVMDGSGSETITSNGEAFYDLFINDGLVYYYKFDETAADSCIGGANDSCDSSGYGYDAAFSTAPEIVTNVAPTLFSNSRALDFDDDNTEYMTASADGLPTDDFTLAAWINIDDDTNNPVILMASDGAGGNTNEILFYVDSGGGLDAQVNNTNTSSSTDLISANTWHHVAMRREGSTIDFFVDASENNTTSIGGTLDYGSCDLLIGTDADNGCSGTLTNYMDGTIDDLRIYNRALSNAEIQILAAGWSGNVGLGTYTLEDTLDVDGNIYLNAGELDTKSSEDNTINLAGSWYNNGAEFTTDGGNVVLNGTSGTHEVLAGYHDFYRLQVNGSGGTWNLISDMQLSDDLDVDAGTLDAVSYDLIIADELDLNAGTLDFGLGTHSVSGNIDLTNGTLVEDASTLLINPNGSKTIDPDGEAVTNVVLTTTDGLLGYWKLDETSTDSNSCSGGEDACDSSGNTNHGTQAGTPTASTDLAPLNFSNVRSWEFDGTDDRVEVLSGNALTVFSISLWIKTEESGSSGTFWQNPTIFGKSDSSANSGDVAIISTSGNAGFWSGLTAGDESYTGGSTAINDNKWHHLALVNNGSTMSLYVDGVDEGTALNTGTALNSEDFWIGGKGGSESPGQYHEGIIDEVRFYNRELTVEEVYALARAHPLDQDGDITQSDDINIDGNIVLADGTWATGSNNINIAGDWTNESAAFTAGTGTVDFDVDTNNNAIFGDTTFYILSISTGTAKTVTFESGSTTTIAASGTLTFTGASGQELTLAPGTAATDWLLTMNGSTQNVSYVSVTYSDASGGTEIDASGGTNTDGAPGGTNTNWTFGSRRVITIITN